MRISKSAIEKMASEDLIVLQGVSGAKLTSFGSGGKVDLYIVPTTVTGLIAAVDTLQKEAMPYRVIGNGSNILIADSGCETAIISLARLNKVQRTANRIYCEAGSALAAICREAMCAGLAGGEFMQGIPATFGGAVVCNAGAYGQQMSDILRSVTLLQKGRIMQVNASSIGMEYHRSNVPDIGIVISGIIELYPTTSKDIVQKMASFYKKRRQSQPMQRSAGSVFRRVGNTPAAVYIEETGLKGLQIGGALLSTVHCNFIVNEGGATTADYFAVGDRVREEVYNNCGVWLEYEVEKLC